MKPFAVLWPTLKSQPSPRFNQTNPCDNLSCMEKIESNRAAALLQAQNNANELFQAVVTQGLIRPHVTESQINQDIYDLAEKMFGISTYWHKRIVRAGS